MAFTIGVTFDGSLPLPGQKLMPSGHEPIVVRTAEDLDRFIAGLIEDYGSHAAYARVLEAPIDEETGVPAQSLAFAVNRNGEIGGLKHYDEDTVWYALGDKADDEVSYAFFGNSAPWPVDSQIPLDQVKTAVNYFREHAGARWDGVDWKPWPADVPL